MKPGIFARSTAGYLVVLFLLGSSNVYAILKLVQFNTFILDSQKVENRLLDTEKKLFDSMFSQRRYEQKYLLTKDAVLYTQFRAAKNDFDGYLASLSTAPLSPAQKDSVAKVNTYHQRYQYLVNAEVQFLKENRKYDINWYKVEKEKASDVVLKELEELEDRSYEDVLYKAKMVGEAGKAAQRVAVISFLMTVLLAILLSFLITRSITNPLIKLVKKTREIPNSLFDCDLDISAPPEITELTEAFTVMCFRLKEVDQLKADFFSMISHELRTPLTTIKEGTNLLLEGAGGTLTEKQGRLLTIISAESNRLTVMVNSILDLSKMEAGMMKYIFEQESIVPLIAKAMTEIAPYAESKKIRLESRINPDIASYRMDGARILDVLRNLIGNAVKFTPEGGLITLAAYPTPDGLEVSVSDTGPGIPQENLTTIFDKFESSDPKKGTGLGLAIVKNIIAAHGGKVWAKSKPGKGSIFTFALPS
jgi:two-component system sensor histidine kinase GlrK